MSENESLRDAPIVADQPAQSETPAVADQPAQSETPAVADQPAQPSKPMLSDAEIDKFLTIMTRMNNRSYHMDELNQHERTMTVFLYTGALNWLTKHDVSFTYDSKQRRYVRC
jgi:hypothetical protein